MSTKKHFTAISTQEGEKLTRYAFLDKTSTSCVNQNRWGRIVHEIKFPTEFNGLFSVKYNEDFSKLITSYGCGAIKIIDVLSSDNDYFVREPQKNPLPIMCVRCIPGNKNTFFAAGLCGNIFICKYEKDGNKKFADEKMNEVNSIDVDMSGENIISGGKDAAIRLYDVKTKKLKMKLVKSGRDDENGSLSQFHAMRIFAVKFHPKEPQTFLSGGWDDEVKVWDVRVKDGCVKRIPGPHICGDSIDIKEKTILTGSWTASNSLQTWDLSSGRLIENICPSNRVQTLDGEFLYCCQFFQTEGNSDVIIAGGSGTGNVEIISVKEQKIMNTFRVHKTIQAIDSNSMSNIVFGGMESVIRIAQLD